MKTENGMTLLHWACAGDAPECVQLLLDAGANIDNESEYFDDSDRDFEVPYVVYPPPLFYCMHETSECLEIMISAGASVHEFTMFNGQMKSPVHFALAANSPMSLTTLAKAGTGLTRSDIGCCDADPLRTAFTMDPIPFEALQALLEYNKDVPDQMMDYIPILYWVIDYSTLDGVRVLVEGGADVTGCEPNWKFENDSAWPYKALQFAEKRLSNPRKPSDFARLTATVSYLKSLPCFSEEQ